MSYDEKCAELAQYFLLDEYDDAKERFRLEPFLAQDIQNTIEAFFEARNIKSFDPLSK